MPSIPTFYSTKDLETDPVTPNSNFGTYTNFVNLLDMCGIAVPTPPRSDGRPGSVTFLAPAGKDALVAALALDLEAAGGRRLGATTWPAPAKTSLPAPAPRTQTLAVCGAHMSGLPLNHQLTDRNATFRARARTSDAYSFYALAGGPPFRPGLVRGRPGTGAKIAVELWDIPSEHVGSFLASIPAPLGLGTIELEDGTQVQGFLCETIGTRNGTDITATGDWRVYMSEIADT